MKRLKNIFFSLLVLSLCPEAGMMAQTSSRADASANVSAEIVPIYTTGEKSQLNFGKFYSGPGGGKIILTPESTISVFGSIFTGNSTPNAASFYISGDANSAYSISLPDGPVVLTNVSQDRTILVEDWKSIPSWDIGSVKMQNGFQVVYIGATIKVGTVNDIPVGVYTGSYTITFDFN